MTITKHRSIQTYRELSWSHAQAVKTHSPWETSNCLGHFWSNLGRTKKRWIDYVTTGQEEEEKLYCETVFPAKLLSGALNTKTKVWGKIHYSRVKLTHAVSITHLFYMVQYTIHRFSVSGHLWDFSFPPCSLDKVSNQALSITEQRKG